MPLEPTDTCEKDLWAQGGPNLRIHCTTRPMGFMKATVVLQRMGSPNPYAPANSGHYWAYLLAADNQLADNQLVRLDVACCKRS